MNKNKRLSLFLVSILFLNVLSTSPFKVKAIQIFSNGFEEGDFSAWTSQASNNGSYSVENTCPKEGTYHGHFNVTSEWGAYARTRKNLGSEELNVYCRAYYKLSSLPHLTDRSIRLMVLQDSTTWTMAYIEMYYNGSDVIYRLIRYNGTAGAEQSIIGTEVVTAVANTYFSLELHMKVSNSTGEVHVYENGLELTSLTATGFDTLGVVDHLNIGQIIIGIFFSNYDNALDVDSVVVDSNYIGQLANSAPSINSVDILNRDDDDNLYPKRQYTSLINITDLDGYTTVELVQLNITGEDNVEISTDFSNEDEARIVFFHSASLSSDFNFTSAIAALATYNITYVILESAGNNYARYGSSIIPNGWNALGPLIANATPYGIKVIASMNIMSGAYSGDGLERRILRWYTNGTLEREDWLCPSNPNSTSLIKDIVQEMFTNHPNLAGFLFDYARYQMGDECYCDSCKAQFEDWLGEGIISPWPGDFAPNGTRRDEFIEWRTHPINDLVNNTRQWILEINSDAEFSAALWGYAWHNGEPGVYPSYWRYWIGQDAVYWISKGWMDWVATMFYTDNTDTLPIDFMNMRESAVGGIEGKIPFLAWIDNAVDGVSTPYNFSQRVEELRSVGADGWALWAYGGPGDPFGYPDFRDYFDYIVNSTTEGWFQTNKLSNINAKAYSNTAVVSWETNRQSNSTVEYSTEPLFNTTIEGSGGSKYYNITHLPGSTNSSSSLVTDHEIVLTGLSPETTYYFRVQSGRIEGTVSSKESQFTTSGNSTLFSVQYNRTADTFTVLEGDNKWELIENLSNSSGSGNNLLVYVVFYPEYDAISASDLDILAWVKDINSATNSSTEINYLDVITDLVTTIGLNDTRGDISQGLTCSGDITFSGSSLYPVDAEFTNVKVYNGSDILKATDSSIENGAWTVEFSAPEIQTTETYNIFIDIIDGNYTDGEENIPTITYIADRHNVVEIGANSTNPEVGEQVEIYVDVESEYDSHKLVSGDTLDLKLSNGTVIPTAYNGTYWTATLMSLTPTIVTVDNYDTLYEQTYGISVLKTDFSLQIEWTESGDPPNNPPNPPTLTNPANGTRYDKGEQVTFSWTFSDPDGGDTQSAYRLQIDNNPEFNSPEFDSNKVVSISETTNRNLPNSVDVFYWRVKTWDQDDSEGTWASPPRYIVSELIKVIDIIANDTSPEVNEAVELTVQLIYESDSTAITTGTFTLEDLSLSHSGGGDWILTDSKNQNITVVYNTVAGSVGEVSGVNMNGQSETVVWGTGEQNPPDDPPDNKEAKEIYESIWIVYAMLGSIPFIVVGSISLGALKGNFDPQMVSVFMEVVIAIAACVLIFGSLSLYLI